MIDNKCPWCWKEMFFVSRHHMSGECVGNVYNQLPHPFGDEWCDPEWRHEWLDDMDDEEIDSLSDEELREKNITFEVVNTTNEPFRIFGEYAISVREIISSMNDSSRRRIPVQPDGLSYRWFRYYLEGLKKLEGEVS